MIKLSFGSLPELWEYGLSLPKTLLFNFRYFPFKVAVKLPVFISHRVLLRELSGKVELRKIKRGIVKIGFGDPPLFDSRRARTVLRISGRLVFEGSADFGPGCQLEVSGQLTVGDNFAITGFTLISAREDIAFGKNVIVSWNVSVMDHDWHDITDKNGNLLNPAKAIAIGDDVWIGFRSIILKGCTIPNGVIVAAGTTVTGRNEVANAIIAGDSKLRVIKADVFWRR
jgi:acetyltransferase-like isoleucine patch superfamily enzyme